MGELRFFDIEGGQETAPLPNDRTPLEDTGGFIKLYRKALECPELSGDAAGLGLFVTLLLLARWRPGSLKREPLQAGQLAASIASLCKQSGLSRIQVRRRFAVWSKAGMIRANQRANRYHVITICNFRLYQGGQDGAEPTEKPSESQPGANREPTDLLKAPVSGHSRAPKKERREEGKKESAAQARLVVLDLNEVTGKRFRQESKGTLRLIMARLGEGYTLEDFKRVHRIKAAKWKGDLKMDEYLCPKTLYAPSNFEKYLNESSPAVGSGPPPVEPVRAPAGWEAP